MALALSPQHRIRPAVSPARPDSTLPGLKLSIDCRTRRNHEVRERYLAEARIRQQQIFLRRRLVVSVLALTVAAAACLGVRSLANRGDGTASLPTVTPNGPAVVFGSLGADTEASGVIDVSAAFIQGQQFYVVQPGDTLWSIASSLTDGSIRSFVSELIDLNGSASIDVGQRLVLPGS